MGLARSSRWWRIFPLLAFVLACAACATAEAVPVATALAPKTVLVPLPSYGFDPTESAVPWKKIKLAGHRIVFATPNGRPAEADRRMLTGEGLPALFRASLKATSESADLYAEMARSAEFRSPISYADVRPGMAQALLLPGGHDKGMRVYLESAELQKAVAWFFDHDRPVGAICHGTLLAARSRSQRTGKSVLWGRRTTGLTRAQEMFAYSVTKGALGDYYRTYPVPMADEVTSFLRSPDDFDPGPELPMPLMRDSDTDPASGFTVRDGRYLSARWPGDAHRFGNEFVVLLAETP
jgi:protease I